MRYKNKVILNIYSKLVYSDSACRSHTHSEWIERKKEEKKMYGRFYVTHSMRFTIDFVSEIKRVYKSQSQRSLIENVTTLMNQTIFFVCIYLFLLHRGIKVHGTAVS